MKSCEEYYSIDIAMQVINSNTDIICDEAKIVDLFRQNKINVYGWYSGAILHVTFDNYPEYCITAISHESKFFKIDRSDDIYLLIQNDIKNIKLIGYINEKETKTNLLKGFQFTDEKYITPRLLSDLKIKSLSYIELEELGIIPLEKTYNRSDLRISKLEVSNFIKEYNIGDEITAKTSSVRESDLLTLLDEKHPYYAPDLALGIRMWLENYKDASPHHKTLHKPNFDSFLNKHGIKMNEEANKRLREVSSPFSTWSTIRKEKQAEAQREA